jgi:hypothetical protein
MFRSALAFFQNQPVALDAVREFETTTGKTILISNPCGGFVSPPPREDGQIRILLHALPPTDNPRRQPRRRSWGSTLFHHYWHLQGDSLTHETSMPGERLLDPVNRILGVMFDGDAYLVHNVASTPQNQMFWVQFLRLLRVRLTGTDAVPVTPELLASAVAGALIDARITAAQRSVEAQRTTLDQATQALLESRNRIERARSEIGLVGQPPTAAEIEKWQAEYRRLRAIKKVEKVIVRPDRALLTVETSALTLVNPRTRSVHLVGRMRINIDFQGRSVTFRNLDRRVNGFDHPHVNNGRPCLGNINDAVSSLFNNGEPVALVQLLLGYLGTCNPEDAWGARVTNWPLAPTPETTDAVPAR